jgi:DNA-binding NarL/FixJ family response regulator
MNLHGAFTGTVKVHIRTIMKKLKATNRTEVACKLNEMYSGDEHT